VGNDFLHVPGDGDAARDLAPRHFDQGVEAGVVGPLEVLVRVRREWLDMFGRICAAHLTEPLPDATGEWTEVRLRFAAVKAARTLLSFGANVDAAVAAEVVECYQSNARLAAR
jgi:hypothetical protein